MAELLTGIGIGLAVGIFLTAAFAERWLQQYTTRADALRARHGDRRYQEGWYQGRDDQMRILGRLQQQEYQILRSAGVLPERETRQE